MFRSDFFSLNNLIIYCFKFLILITILYQIKDFHDNYEYAAYYHNRCSAIKNSEICKNNQKIFAVKVSDGTITTTCEEASQVFYENIYTSAFKKFIESKIIYRIIMMESYEIKLGIAIIFLVSLWFITNFMKHCYTIDSVSLPVHGRYSHEYLALESIFAQLYNNNTPNRRLSYKPANIPPPSSSRYVLEEVKEE